MHLSTTMHPEPLVLANGTRSLGDSISDGPGIGGAAVLVSGWAQLAVCVVIVVLCCCFSLMCLCTSCICCSNDPEAVRRQVIATTPTTVICDKPPSYDEAQRTSACGLPNYQEAIRRESQISIIHVPQVC